MWNLGKLAISAALASTLVLSGCGGSGEANLFKDLQIELASWKLTDKALEAYPKLPEDKAKKKYANDMMFQYFRKEKDPEKRHLMAAMVYLGYAQMNTRARPAYCGKMNVDISAFKARFEAQHKAQTKSVDMILAKHELSRDMVWEHNERMMMISVKNDLMRAGGLNGTRSLCSDIKKKPQKYAEPFNFTKIMPIAAAQLRQAKTLSETRHAELTAVPALRK